jgi:hypothetical protein
LHSQPLLCSLGRVFEPGQASDPVHYVGQNLKANLPPGPLFTSGKTTIGAGTAWALVLGVV